MKDHIREIIDALPKNILNEMNKTQHLFYGENEGLDCAKGKIIKNSKDAIFSHENESLVLVLDTNINEETLLEAVKHFQHIASSCKIKYDGFEIMLDEHEVDQPELPPFEKFFKPQSYVKIQLSNNKYAYILFLGGNLLEGYFFECLSLADDGNACTALLDNTSRVFRQPIQGIFNPHSCSYVGAAQNKCLPANFSFRLLEDAPAPEEIDELYQRYHIAESENNSWLRVMEKMVQFGDQNLACKSTMKYDIAIDKTGKAKWNNIFQPLKDKENPMPFGCFLNYDKLNAIFTVNINELALIDKVYSEFIKDKNASITQQ